MVALVRPASDITRNSDVIVKNKVIEPAMWIAIWIVVKTKGVLVSSRAKNAF
ncbi:unannotated protein [freshwater metagenome]|uniref:Unannotated protein n=1 Tax=freshwater metagenome TaxID=449393 RepID=A0A6J6D974_9ZZZZ